MIFRHSYSKTNRILSAAVLLPVVFCVTVLSCRKVPSRVLERQELFTIDYGNFEEQINLFHLDSPYARPDSQLYMKDGFFYISNSASGKIMKMTSFGDLLSLYYDPDKNPQPSFADSEQKESLAATQKAVVYPLNHPSYVLVTDRKHLFAVDTLPDERIDYEQTENTALRTVVVRFNESGTAEIIGQEGIGGIPFPIVHGLYTTSENELIVVSRNEQAATVFWYDADGRLLYKIPIAYNAVPVPDNQNEKFFSNIDTIIPGYTEKKLYIKADYYHEEIDPATHVNAGISYHSSRLYTFNIETKQYEQNVLISPYEGSETVAGTTVHFKKVYNVLGVTRSNWCFLTTPIEDGYMLQMIHIPTSKTYRRKLSIAADELAYNAFNLSPDGILSALIAQKDHAVVAWWRTDGIIGAENNAEKR